MRVALLRGKEGEDDLAAELSGIGARLQGIRQTTANRESVLLGLAMLHALKGDRALLASVLEEYDRVRLPDALAPIDNDREVALILALAGDYPGALDRIERAVSGFGPWEFGVYALDPWFDGARDDPRFRALEDGYRRWLEDQLR